MRRSLVILFAQLILILGVYKLLQAEPNAPEDVVLTVYFISDVTRPSPPTGNATVETGPVQNVFNTYNITQCFAKYPYFDKDDDLFITLSNGIVTQLMNREKIFLVTIPGEETLEDVVSSLNDLEEVLFVDQPIEWEDLAYEHPDDPRFDAGDIPGDEWDIPYPNQWAFYDEQEYLDEDDPSRWEGGHYPEDRHYYDINIEKMWERLDYLDNFDEWPVITIAQIEGSNVVNFHDDLDDERVEYPEGQGGGEIHAHPINVASVMASLGNNDYGLAGVNWNCHIYSINIRDRNDFMEYWYEDIREREPTPKVINVSIATTARHIRADAEIEEAVNLNYASGILTVAGSGNQDLEGPDRLVSSFGEGVLCVGISDYKSYPGASLDFSWRQSQYGRPLDVLAPGIRILVLNYLENESVISPTAKWGTSLSAPFVSGLASLIFSYWEYQFSHDQEMLEMLTLDDVKGLIRFGSLDINHRTYVDEFDGWDERHGYGIIDVDNTLRRIEGDFIFDIPDRNDLPTGYDSDESESKVITVMNTAALWENFGGELLVGEDLDGRKGGELHEVRKIINYVKREDAREGAIGQPNIWGRGYFGVGAGHIYEDEDGNEYRMGHSKEYNSYGNDDIDIFYPDNYFAWWGDIPWCDVVEIDENSFTMRTYIFERIINQETVGWFPCRPENLVWDYAISYDPVTALSVPNKAGIIVMEYSLMQNYPNPFNNSTNLRFELDKPMLINLSVYDLQGRLVSEIINEHFSYGKHKLLWNMTEGTSGIYFLRLSNGANYKTKRIHLLK
ncbi:MAG: S8 family serine peptidase [Candidatus Hatepunaea meridiana]|nr:S8 family serine peptidase [Candidatus Hatepunaea meridiana]